MSEKNIELPEQCKTCKLKESGCSGRLSLKIAVNDFKRLWYRTLHLKKIELDDTCPCYEGVNEQ